MSKRFWFTVFALLIAASMVLAACGPKATPTPVPQKTEAPTQAPQPTTPPPTPTPKPHTGAWVDEVVVSTFDQEQAIARLKAGDVDIYADTLTDPDLLKEVKSNPDLEAAQTATGSMVDIHVNPTEFKEGFNPFHDPKIREALHWLLDREYVAKNIQGGLATPMYTALSPNMPEYVNIIDTMKALEAKYRYNPEKGQQVIADRMKALGAEMKDGKWYMNGEPVVVHFLIRTDLWKNKQIGDLFSDQLEKAGFTVDRQYKTRDETSPIVFGSDPTDGTWNLYIGGWGNSAIPRDESSNWGFFYTKLGIGVPLWQAYNPPKEAFEIAKKLWNGQYDTIQERTELMRKAAEMFTAWNTHMFVVMLTGFQPYRKGLSVAYDLAAGIGGSDLWPYTIRWADKTGGTVKFAEKSLFIDPWNPVDGSNWAYDLAVQAATNDKGVFMDPYTGLARPERVEKAEIDVVKGTPVQKTLDWVDLKFVDKIDVPGDAWVDWDAKAQKWITADEMNAKIQAAKDKVDKAKATAKDLASKVETIDENSVKTYLADLAKAYGVDVDVEAYFKDKDAAKALTDKVAEINKADDKAAALAAYGVDFLSQQDAATFDLAGKDLYKTAKMVSIVTYPKDLFQKVTWQDGSHLSVGDFVYNMILTFDRGKKDSAIYDESAADNLAAYLSHFKGVKIVSTDPLTIATYDDGVATLDAENLVTTWFPQHAQGWDVLSIAAAAEADGKLAFSSDKADKKKAEWTSFIAGPSLKILAQYLDEAAKNNTIPYAPTLKKYITTDEAKTRYANLQKFYKEYGHFWVGNGPFILTQVDTTNKTAVLKRYEAFSEQSDKWSIFGAPMLATVEIDGDAQVVQGKDASFDAYVTFKDKPYPSDQLEKVEYLVFDENGNMLTRGEAKMSEEGTYQITIPGDVTSKFTAGSLKLEVVAVSKAVAVPGVASFDFVVVAP